VVENEALIDGDCCCGSMSNLGYKATELMNDYIVPPTEKRERTELFITITDWALSF